MFPMVLEQSYSIVVFKVLVNNFFCPENGICFLHLLNIFKFSRDIEDIYFFEVNTKYISSSVLKTSEFS